MFALRLSHFLSVLKTQLTCYLIPFQNDKKQRLKRLYACTLGWVFISIILLSHYHLSVNNEQRYTLHKEKITVDLIEQSLAENLANMAADAKNFAFISHTLMRLPASERKQKLKQTYLQFIQNQHDYSQIRLLDNKGREQVRINHQGDVYEVVNETNLQDKSQRYYFQKSRQLAPNQVYISPLDQNMEEGKNQQPITPTIRVSAPIYHQGQLIGVIVLNYRALPLIEKLLNLSPYFLNRLYIINDEGAVVIQPNQKKPNSFSFNTSEQLPNNIKILLDSQDSGRLVNQDAYLTFATHLAPDNQRWHVISSFSKQYFTQIKQQFFQQYWGLYALLYSLTTLICLYIVFSQARHQQQAKKQAYEQQFRQVLEQIPFMAVSLNQQGRVVFCNDYFLSHLGYQKSEVLEQDWVELCIPFELKQKVRASLTQALSQGQNQASFKDVILDKSGHIRLVSWTSTYLSKQVSDPSLMQDQQFGVLTFVGQDITQQEQSQAQLKQLNHVVEQSQNSVMITDLNGKIIYVNPTFCEVTGYQATEVIGISPKFLQSGEMKNADYDRLWQDLIAGNEWRGELHNRKKDGSLFWERAVISPVKDVAGKNLYYVGVKQDISQEKHLAQALEAETQQRIQHEKLAAIGKVVSMIAHDLRNPLSSIKMVLQMYQRKNQDELCQISLQQVRYMEAILADLLTYSKPEKRQAQWLDINKFLSQIILGQARFAREHRACFEVQLESHLPTLFADPTKLKQALQNLIINGIQACQATEASPKAKVIISSKLISLGEEGHLFNDLNREQTLTYKKINPKNEYETPYVLIEIKNTGKAIEEALISKVFEPFFTTKASGTGLGLAIVKRIITLHEGLIDIGPYEDSLPHKNAPVEQGTRVCIALPIHSASQSQHQVIQESHEQITHL